MRMHGRTFLAVGAASAALVALTACGASGGSGATGTLGSGSASAGATAGGGPASTGPGGAGGAGSAGGSGGSASGPAAGLRTCPASALAADIVNRDEAAGHTDEQILFTNNGPSTCVLGGFPGVSFLDAGGRMLGAAADREQTTAPLVTLAPGRHAVAHLTVAHIGPIPGCEQDSGSATATSIRIYPPALHDALTIAADGQRACTSPGAHQLTVGPVTAA